MLHTKDVTITIKNKKLKVLIEEGNGVPCLILGPATIYPDTFPPEFKKQHRFIMANGPFEKDSGFGIEDFPTVDSFAKFYIEIIEQLQENNHIPKEPKPRIFAHSVLGVFLFRILAKNPELFSEAIDVATPLGKSLDEVVKESTNHFLANHPLTELINPPILGLLIPLIQKHHPKILHRLLTLIAKYNFNRPYDTQAEWVKSYAQQGPFMWHNPKMRHDEDQEATKIWNKIQNLNIPFVVHCYDTVMHEAPDGVKDQIKFLGHNGDNKARVILAFGADDASVPFTLWTNDLRAKTGIETDIIESYIFPESAHWPFHPAESSSSLFDTVISAWLEAPRCNADQFSNLCAALEHTWLYDRTIKTKNIPEAKSECSEKSPLLANKSSSDNHQAKDDDNLIQQQLNDIKRKWITDMEQKTNELLSYKETSLRPG